MRPATIGLVLLASAGCGGAGNGAKRADRATGEVTAASGADWAELRYGSRCRLQNNVWNEKDAAGPHEQVIFLETLGGRPAFGWQWEWPEGGAVVAAPEVKYGDSPWDAPSGLETEFPLRAGSADISVDFDVHLDAQGVYNMAFSLWTVSSLPASQERISHEIMLWTMSSGLTPAGTLHSTHAVDGVTFDLYVAPGHHDDVHTNRWTYLAFQPVLPHEDPPPCSGDSCPPPPACDPLCPPLPCVDCGQGGGAGTPDPILHGPFRVSAFIDILLDEGLLPDTAYLASLELMNEVVGGIGLTELKDYAVHVTPRR